MSWVIVPPSWSLELNSKVLVWSLTYRRCSVCCMHGDSGEVDTGEWRLSLVSYAGHIYLAFPSWLCNPAGSWLKKAHCHGREGLVLLCCIKDWYAETPKAALGLKHLLGRQSCRPTPTPHPKAPAGRRRKQEVLFNLLSGFFKLQSPAVNSKFVFPKNRERERARGWRRVSTPMKTILFMLSHWNDPLWKNEGLLFLFFLIYSPPKGNIFSLISFLARINCRKKRRWQRRGEEDKKKEENWEEKEK